MTAVLDDLGLDVATVGGLDRPPGQCLGPAAAGPAAPDPRTVLLVTHAADRLDDRWWVIEVSQP